MVSGLLWRIGFATASSLLFAACFPGERPIAQRMACAGDTCACMAGYDNCDGQPFTGCETDLNLDPRHCGACGVRCDNGQCVDGECEPAQDYVNCNLSWHDGFEAHLQSDPENCGACGYDCMGGTCANGRCEPYLLVEPGLQIAKLAADHTHLYFCETWSESVMRVPQAGGAVEVLAVDQGCWYGVAVAGDALYWETDVGEDRFLSLIVQGSVSSGEVTVIGSGETTWSVRARGDTVAWGVTPDDGTFEETIVARSSVSADPVEVYRSAITLGALALTDDYVVFLEYDGDDDPMAIMRVPIDGGQATQLADVGTAAINGLQAVDDHVFWVQWVGANPDDDEYTIMKVPVAGGTPTELYRGHNLDKYDSSYVSLSVDSSGVYWAEQEGVRLLHLPADAEGEPPEVLAEYQEVQALTTGPTAVFWHDSPAMLYGLPKGDRP